MKKTWLELVKKGESVLEAHGIEDPRLESEILLSALVKVRRLDLYLRQEDPVDSGVAERFEDFLSRRGSLEPIQYITGYESFLNRNFSVGPGVFIPRPETEGLVRSALSRLKEGPFLELGAGSGCVSISLLLEQNTCKTGYAVDLSPDALLYARANAVTHGVASSLHFIEGDLFSTVPTRFKGSFEVVVSNPPYLDLEQDQQIETSVKKFEPKLALDGGAGGLDIYSRILMEGSAWIKQGGFLVMEIGLNQSGSLAFLVQEQPCWEWVEVSRDEQGIERILTLLYKGDSCG
ncbi:MAG: peptide chain release factor N(5)-glutamine methyltransferase [Nitrospirae bacterium]|nr:peptide chain release factor N(5)-glutamine methyltransferase [Nitrospirota bacterium]